MGNSMSLQGTGYSVSARSVATKQSPYLLSCPSGLRGYPDELYVGFSSTGSVAFLVETGESWIPPETQPDCLRSA